MKVFSFDTDKPLAIQKQNRTLKRDYVISLLSTLNVQRRNQEESEPTVEYVEPQSQSIPENLNKFKKINNTSSLMYYRDHLS